MSDTQSNKSFSSDHTSVGMAIEEIGQLAFPDVVPRRIVMLNHTLAVLSEDNRLVMGELRSRGGEEWTIISKSTTNLAKEERKVLDLAILPGPSCSVVVLLIERKNKERYLACHNIKRGGKTLELGEEFSSYDKANVLGKGTSHIAADTSHSGGEPSVFSVSNLIRKLRLEDGGTALKPTPARAQVPAEYQDGILNFCVQPLSVGNVHVGGSRPSTGSRPSQGQQANIVIASKTKSASAKSKFAIDWFFSGKKDEITNCKATLKLGEDSEPIAILVDPKDSKAVFALCVNRTSKSTSLFKLSKGRRGEDAIITFNFEVSAATTGLSADPLSSSSVPSTLMLMFDSSQESQVLRIYSIQKTEGFRARHPICAHCPSLEMLSSPSHIIVCPTQSWKLSHNQADLILSSTPRALLVLATLIDPSNNRIVTETDTGEQYRLRVLGCDTQNLHPEAIILEDLERVFEDGGEDARLATYTLKLCMSHPPCNNCQSQMSAWLMSGRLQAIELFYVTRSDGVSNGSYTGSDRFTQTQISPEKFRSFITDSDWTQSLQRQGTFTLTPEASASATPRGTSPRSRIPTPRVSSASNRSLISYSEEDVDGVEDPEEDLQEMRRQLISRLASKFNLYMDFSNAQKSNFSEMQSLVQELQKMS